MGGRRLKVIGRDGAVLASIEQQAGQGQATVSAGAGAPAALTAVLERARVDAMLVEDRSQEPPLLTREALGPERITAMAAEVTRLWPEGVGLTTVVEVIG